MTKADEIHARLAAAFPQAAIEVVNQSENHRGHAGYVDGETHYLVRLKAPELMQMNRVARQRAVYKALGEDLMGRIHALALEITE